MPDNTKCKTTISLYEAKSQCKILLPATQEDEGKGYPENFLSFNPPKYTRIDMASDNTAWSCFAETIAKLHTNGDNLGLIKTGNNGRLGELNSVCICHNPR